MLVLDPDAAPGVWPGCQVVGGGDDWEGIERALRGVREIVARRRQRRAQGETRQFAPLYIVMDEYADVVRNAPAARELVETILRRGRKLGVHLIVGVQDRLVKTLGFEGQSDLRRNFTYVVDVEMFRPELDDDGIVVDIGRAGDTLKRVLSELNFRNLDEVPAFAGRNTTTEFLARIVFDGIVRAIGEGELGAGAAGLERIRVTLHESHVAAASYEGALGARN